MTWWMNESTDPLSERTMSAINQKNVVLQSGPDRCGYAAMQYMANYYGRNVKQISGDQKGPLSMSGMIRLADAFGLEAQGVFCPLSNLPTLKCPCIVILNGSHFVVLESISQVGYALVMDPAQGRRRITWEKFFTEWEGLTLLVTDPELENGPDRNQAPDNARHDQGLTDITE